MRARVIYCLSAHYSCFSFCLLRQWTLVFDEFNFTRLSISKRSWHAVRPELTTNYFQVFNRLLPRSIHSASGCICASRRHQFGSVVTQKRGGTGLVEKFRTSFCAVGCQTCDGGFELVGPSGNGRWSSTNLTSPGCQFPNVRGMPFDPNSPPTTSKCLTDSYREVSTQLLVAFVRLEGTNLAQLLRKSVEARDWLKNLEPRSVRSVVKRVMEDLSLLDRQIGQLFPSCSRGHKDRLSDTRSVRSGHTSSLRPTGSSHFLDKVSRSGSTGLPNTSNELDPSLATQLRRLFTQRVDIFASVEANRESLLLGVIKIGLKTLVECVRLQTFGKFGLQQIQVDCRFLQIHLWHFVSDEKLIGMLLDDVIYSVVQRCVDPQLMDESVSSHLKSLILYVHLDVYKRQVSIIPRNLD
ncbi:hypothetical protein AHF37_04731 [Paragonimus kellicotti]|nr:hypothetical protein AHF37_04731 [Paragonimus kellicotti]